MLGGFSFAELADGVLDDVVDDVSRGVVDSTCLFDFGLLLDDGAVTAGKPDDLAEELLVDVAEDFGGEDGEFIRALRKIKIVQNPLQGGVVDYYVWGQLVRRLGAVLFRAKMERPELYFASACLKS